MSTERFDKAAADWDAKPLRVQLGEAISTAIIASLPLTGAMVGLEYGCGTGLVTFKLAAHLAVMHGLDSSSGMIQVLTEKIHAQGVENVKPFLGELSELAPPPLDLTCISMTLHHIEDYHELLTRFAKYLKPGGFLAIADLEKEDGTFHDDNTGIAHFGFEGDALCKVVVECGFVDVEMQTIYKVTKNERQYPVFLLTCRKK